MAEYFTTALAAGLAVAVVNGYFAWHDHGPRRSARAFLGWLAAFVAAGVAAPHVASWLLANVF